MNIAVAYCYPLLRPDTYFGLAQRFAQTWQQFPPGDTPCVLHVICNGREAIRWDLQALRGIQYELKHHDNRGWDIGAFQFAAESIPCDLLVCFGAPVHFYRAGWLDRIADVFMTTGPALYGAWGVPYRTNWHIRTTAFWFPPQLLQAYPEIIVSSQQSRHGFEHGRGCFTLFAEQNGFDPLMVTWTGVYPKDRWTQADGGPGSCLLFDQHTHR